MKKMLFLENLKKAVTDSENEIRFDPASKPGFQIL